MKKGFKNFFTLAVILFAGVLFIFSPYFYIKEVIINGCEHVTVEEIRLKMNADKTSNIFLFNSNSAKKKIMENLYIESVSFIKKLPGSLTVNIRERHLSGYVNYMDDQFLFLDENGRVLEINTYFTEAYPIVSGLKFTKVRLGEILEVEDNSAFKTVVQYARLLNSHQLTQSVSRIDVSDAGNTRIILDDIEFNLGDDKSGDEKIRTVKEISEKLSDAGIEKAIVDIRDVDGQYVGKILS